LFEFSFHQHFCTLHTDTNTWIYPSYIYIFLCGISGIFLVKFIPFIQLFWAIKNFVLAFPNGLFRIYLNYFCCAHFAHTQTHMHWNTRRETRTQTQQTYRIFHCAYVFGGWWAVRYINVCVSLYILWRGPNRNSKVLGHRRRRRPSTSNSIDTMSPEHIGKVLTTDGRARCLGQPSFPPPKKHVKAALQRARLSCWVSGRRERGRKLENSLSGSPRIICLPSHPKLWAYRIHLLHNRSWNFLTSYVSVIANLWANFPPFRPLANRCCCLSVFV